MLFLFHIIFSLLQLAATFMPLQTFTFGGYKYCHSQNHHRRHCSRLLFNKLKNPGSNKHTTSRNLGLEDEIQDVVYAATPLSKKTDDEQRALFDAAATVTQQSCHLLGIKSIGVDYGLARTGLAVTVGYTPKPLQILTDLVNATDVAQAVVRICESEQANRIVVGLPLHKNGTIAEQTNLTMEFVQELSFAAMASLGPNVPIYLWDERYTTKLAAARIHSVNPKQNLYAQLDSDAACIILENYYHENGQGARKFDLPQEDYDHAIQIWEQKRKCIRDMQIAAQEDRDAKLRWRKEAIERDRQLNLLQKESEGGDSNNDNSSSGKKKKKKGKKKSGKWINLETLLE